MIIDFCDEFSYLPESIHDLIPISCEASLEFVFKQNGLNFHDYADFVEISITIIDDQEIQLLNKEYRQIDKATDVLSFPIYESLSQLLSACKEHAASPVILGDVVISYPRLLEQARQYGTGITREFTYLLIHSILHLLGFDHLNESDKALMREYEESIYNDINTRT